MKLLCDSDLLARVLDSFGILSTTFAVQANQVELVLMASLHLFRPKFKVLCPFHHQMLLRLAFLAFQPQHNLFGSLGFLVENRFRLATKAHLLRVVTAFPLSEVGGLSCLVLGDLVNLVIAALTTSTVCFALFWDVDHGVGVTVFCE